MVIFNNIRYYLLGLALLFISNNTLGLTKNHPEIDTIRISFEYKDGYAIKYSRVCYAYNHNEYQLQRDKSVCISILKELPCIIEKESIEDLLYNCHLYSSEEQCDFINITEEDYSNYMSILNDSLFYYFPYLQDFPKEQYELKMEEFLSLSCSDIVNMIESQHHHFLFERPCLGIKLELLSNTKKKIVIEPQWFFEGTAWRVKSSGKEVYIGYDYIMSFLHAVHFDKYTCFWEKFNLLFQIAESLVKKSITENHEDRFNQRDRFD